MMNKHVRKRVGWTGLLALATLLVAPLGLEAQVVRGADILEAQSPDQEDLHIPSQSLFDLKAFGDEGATGFRGNGTNGWCINNTLAFLPNQSQGGCWSGVHQDKNGNWFTIYFDVGVVFAAPPSDMPDLIDPTAVKGGGYTVNITSLILGSFVKGGGDKIWASDRSGSELLALGVVGTDDGSCTDFTALRDGFAIPGFQMTPVNDCPPTIPAVGWKGRHPIEKESYLELQASDPAFAPSLDNDPFAFWRVPEELQRTDKFLGTSATYGELQDWYLEGLQRYGGLVPGGTGEPTFEGWPLGITMFYDAFYFPLPSVGNSLFYQATIVNESEKVYGVGVEYDSVYIGINHDPLMMSQADAHYYDTRRSAVITQDPGGGTINCDKVPPGTVGTCPPGGGWENDASAMAITILKSPIGDQRYKLFTDPESEFFNPGHPRAGDTIALNHQHQCGFGGCAGEMTWTRGQRAHFGMLSSTGANMLDGRTPDEISERTYYRSFRPEDWPQRTGTFNKYVPSVHDSKPMWDWNHDGQPDTIYADACGRKGCVTIFADTAPGGWANGYGNVTEISIGPVHMAPGDTVPLVLAFMAANDSAVFEAQMDNAIAFYQRFFLGPEAAPPPRITAVDVQGGDNNQNQVTLFLDDTTEDWRDPFLLALDVSGDVALNPTLDDQVTSLIDNNVAAIHIFKSCDRGGSWTSNAGDCDGDPVSDPTSKWSGFGFQPFQTFEVSPDGTFPNQFVDQNVQPGVEVTYAIVTETFGAEFNLIRGSPGNLSVETVEFAPKLLSGLTASSQNPSVAQIYMPVNLAAGARAAELETLSRTGRSTVPVDLNVINTARTGGQFRVVFADRMTVTKVETLDEGGAVTDVQTSVSAEVTRTVTDANGDDAVVAIQTFDFDRSGTISLAGFATAAPEETGSQRTTVSTGGFGLVVAEGSKPLMASTVLDGDETTPGAFFGQEDFPFFVVNVDASLGGTFNRQIYFDDFDAQVANQVAPSIQWLTGATQSAHLAGDDFGTLVMTWQQDAFGGLAPFRIDDRANVAANFQSAVSSRPTASTSSTDPDLLAAVKESDPNVTIDASELQALDLPFTVRNQTFDRDVTAVVTDHQETVLLGLGVDSLRVQVPQGSWMPGDVMYFVETVTREVTDENGNTVLGANGQPQTETVPVATFRAFLGCLIPRVSCDPTVGGAQSSAYVAFRPDFEHHVEYLTPLAGGDEVTFEVRPAISTAEVDRRDLDLSGVHVVPNPYLFANEFERSTADRVLKFTNLPPEGRIRIYDIAGRFVQEINYVPDDLRDGDLDWNMQTRESLELAAGLYIFALETPEGDRQLGKFVVIR